jgi:hypothetical protein
MQSTICAKSSFGAKERRAGSKHGKSLTESAPSLHNPSCTATGHKGQSRVNAPVEGRRALAERTPSYDWAVLDDSANARLDPALQWIENPANASNSSSTGRGGYSDLYFFGYGHDYKAAMRAFTHSTSSDKSLRPAHFIM